MGLRKWNRKNNNNQRFQRWMWPPCNMVQALLGNIFCIWLRDAYVEKHAENKSQGVAGNVFLQNYPRNGDTLRSSCWKTTRISTVIALNIYNWLAYNLSQVVAGIWIPLGPLFGPVNRLPNLSQPDLVLCKVLLLSSRPGKKGTRKKNMSLYVAVCDVPGFVWKLLTSNHLKWL